MLTSPNRDTWHVRFSQVSSVTKDALIGSRTGVGSRRKVSCSSAGAGDDIPELPLPEVHAGAVDPPLDPAVGVSSSNDSCGRTGAGEHVVAGEPQEAAGRIGDKNSVPYERLVQRLISVRRADPRLPRVRPLEDGELAVDFPGRGSDSFLLQVQGEGRRASRSAAGTGDLPTNRRGRGRRPSRRTRRPGPAWTFRVSRSEGHTYTMPVPGRRSKRSGRPKQVLVGEIAMHWNSPSRAHITKSPSAIPPGLISRLLARAGAEHSDLVRCQVPSLTSASSISPSLLPALGETSGC